MKCFDNKLLLFAHQVVDFCEKMNDDDALADRFADDSDPASLHHSLDKFLMLVLKNFLQSIDEGFADIIDELEDSCADDHAQASRLKRVIVEFQQLSFEKRENFSAAYKEQREENSKNSFAWFDNFFGDVTSLLKNPIHRDTYKVAPQQPQTPNPSDSEPREPQGWIATEKLCLSPKKLSGPEPDLNSPQRDDSNPQDLSVEFRWEKKQLSHSRQELSVGISEDVTWKINFSNEELSSTKSANTKSKKKRKSFDLQTETVSFEDIFSFENISIDGSSSRASSSRLFQLHRKPQQRARRHRCEEALQTPHFQQPERSAVWGLALCQQTTSTSMTLRKTLREGSPLQTLTTSS